MFSAVGCWLGTCVEWKCYCSGMVSGRPQSADSRFCTEYGDDNTECPGFCCTLHLLTYTKSKIQKKYLAFMIVRLGGNTENLKQWSKGEL